jgi:hypothetical protein
VGVWVLDGVNSPGVLEVLRPHVRRWELDVLRVGEGWRGLVEECHGRLEAAFPEYELLNVKQKYGVLTYQAFPRLWVRDGNSWTTSEAAALDAITDEYLLRSESVCEWCGGEAELRGWRSWELTLCDACDERFPDPPYEVRAPLRRK